MLLPWLYWDKSTVWAITAKSKRPRSSRSDRSSVSPLYRLYRIEKKHHSCHGCNNCGKLEGKAGVLPMLCAGLTYGFTPFAPLLLMVGYSLTLPVILAGATGIAFSLARMASPLLLLTVIIGTLSKNAPGNSWFYKEVPAWGVSAACGDAVHYYNLATLQGFSRRFARFGSTLVFLIQWLSYSMSIGSA